MEDAKQIAVAQQDVSTLAMLNNAITKGVDTDTLGKLMDLQQRWEANEARKAYVAAMVAFKAENLTVAKDQVVSYSGTHYTHASLANVVGVVVPAMAKHGLSHQWQTSQANGSVTVRCTITHELGHSESVTLTAPPDDSGRKNGIQQIGSTITYLQRYTLMAITGVAAKDQDDDGQASEPQDESRYSDWIMAVNESIDAAGLKSISDEVIQSFGGPQNVPAPIVTAIQNRKRALKS